MVTVARGGRRLPRPVIALATALAVLGLTAGCAGGEPAADPRPVTTSSSPAEPVRAPLRGTVIAAGEAENPSLAVKIDNHERARPQIGLNTTDLVFEELVEGGYTRYAAIWQSTVPDEVGPVRSIRPMDPDILSPLGGVVAYSGGQQQFVALMQAAPVQNLIFDRDQTHFFRDTSRRAPHNVVLRAADALADYAEVPAPAPQFAYASDPGGSTASVAGVPSARIAMTFSHIRYPSWDWDAATGTYLRHQEDAPDLDSEGQRIATVNVVALKVPVELGDVPRTVLSGSGEGWFSANGHTVQGIWSKDGRDDPLRFTDSSGSSVLLAPGNTWIELVPAETGTIVTG
ncbi:DUF3048 family protein [Klugiella xanthotipulae]|uniref:DUF3048 family protein n=2 Tax=Klugiella xanthotipulae TaxID=244735 RepID=A0A543I4W3_9MICO|nr:DUF3048 family protein [Klugiella xanthotipulae]